MRRISAPISEFRKHHLQALASLFVQVLKLAEAAGAQAFFLPGIAQQSKAKNPSEGFEVVTGPDSAS